MVDSRVGVFPTAPLRGAVPGLEGRWEAGLCILFCHGLIAVSFDFLFLSDIVLSFLNLLIPYFPDIGYLHFIILQKGMNVNKNLLIFDNLRNGCRDIRGK